MSTIGVVFLLGIGAALWLIFGPKLLPSAAGPAWWIFRPFVWVSRPIVWTAKNYRFKKGAFATILLISLLVVGTFFYLFYTIVPDAPLFNTAEGYAHIGFYFLLIALGLLVSTYTEGKTRFVLAALVFIMFAFLGPRTAMLLDPAGHLWDKIFGHTVEAKGAHNANCKGILETFVLKEKDELINFGHACYTSWKIEGGPVTLTQPDGTRKVYASGLPLEDSYQWRATKGSTKVYAAFCPHPTRWDNSREGCF